MVKKVCKECEKIIDLSVDKHVLLGTYTGEKVDDESYFHFACFVKWYNKKVSEKAKNTTQEMQSKVQGLMANPKIAGLMSMIGGTDKLKGMLNTDLNAGSEGLDINKMMADFIGDDPETMKEGTITPLPKKKDDNNDGKTKRKSSTTKKKVQ